MFVQGLKWMRKRVVRMWRRRKPSCRRRRTGSRQIETGSPSLADMHLVSVGFDTEQSRLLGILAAVCKAAVQVYQESVKLQCQEYVGRSVLV